MTEQDPVETQPEPKEPLISVEFQKLLELGEFSNAVELINAEINRIHERITTKLKPGLEQMVKALPVLLQDLDTLDELERLFLQVAIKHLQKAESKGT